MAKLHDDRTPTDAEILKYKNVPVDVAARYIGWSSVTITNALKQERAPFGFSSQNPNTGSFAYNISPGLLVKYKNGDLPTYKLKEVIKLAADGVEEVLNTKLRGIQTLINFALTGDRSSK